MSCEWDEYLDFEELEEQITQIVDHGNLEEMLRIQLSEMEMLQSMFSNPGEFCVDDPSTIADIHEFLDGKTTILPPRLDYTINLSIEDLKLEMCVNLGHDYPATEPDIYVRSNQLNRIQQHSLNSDLAVHILALDRGEICIYYAIAWLQEKASLYFNNKTNPLISGQELCKTTEKYNEDQEYFTRYWIYSHHIFSKIKRREILDLANEYQITGFCLPGKPGIICAEGSSDNCHEWWSKVKCMNWKKIICKKKEVERLNNLTILEDLRKFKNFQEITFESAKNKSRDHHTHTDMGELYRYLDEHNCNYVFQDYFGVIGGKAKSV